MGSALSSFKASAGARARAEAVAPSDDEDDEDTRPTKRRKMSTLKDSTTTPRIGTESGYRQPFGQVTNESERAPSRFSTKIQAVLPSDFYRKSTQQMGAISKRVEDRPKSIRSPIDSLLPKTPLDFKKALRFEISSIVPKSTTQNEPITFARGRKGPIDVKCKCSVTLFYGKNDDDLTVPIRSQDYALVYRKSNFCLLRTTVKDGGDISREFIHLEPFLAPAEEIYVLRKKYSPQGAFQHSFDFAEKYYVQITLEPVGGQKEWPPFDLSSLTNSTTVDDGSSVDSNPVTDLLDGNKLSKNDFYLLGKTTALLDPERQNKSVDLKLSYGSLRQKMPFALRMEMKWSLPSHFSDLPTRNVKIENESPRSKVASAPAASEEIPASPLTRKGEDVSVSNSPVDSRAQRRRSNVPTYNLKTLSALQQGRSPRVRKSRDFRSKSFQGRSADADGTIVTYSFGKADSADLAIKRETTIAGLICPFCNCDHSSIDDLRLHLHLNHSVFKFSLRRSNPPRMGFFVELAKQGPRSSPGSSLDRARTFQLNKPQTLFDLEKFLYGDECWVKAREGPQNNAWPDHLQDRFHESSLSSSPHESRHSSPNTSNDTDDVMDVENYHPKLPVRPRKKFYVPETSKPLYDTITKRVLEPGEEIPSSDTEKDEGWLHQKHRDVILDFTDVTDDEKDYIIRWNPFIMGEQLTCEAYLPDAAIRFVEATNSGLPGE